LEITEETYLDYQEPYKLHNSEIIEDEEAWSEDNLIFNVQMMTQTLTVLVKDELLSIGGIETLMKKIKTRRIICYNQCKINLE